MQAEPTYKEHSKQTLAALLELVVVTIQLPACHRWTHSLVTSLQIPPLGGFTGLTPSASSSCDRCEGSLHWWCALRPAPAQGLGARVLWRLVMLQRAHPREAGTADAVMVAIEAATAQRRGRQTPRARAGVAPASRQCRYPHGGKHTDGTLRTRGVKTHGREKHMGWG